MKHLRKEESLGNITVGDAERRRREAMTEMSDEMRIKSHAAIKAAEAEGDDGEESVIVTMVDGMTGEEVAGPIMTRTASEKLEASLRQSGWEYVTTRIRSDYGFVTEHIFYRVPMAFYMTYQQHHAIVDEIFESRHTSDDEFADILGITDDEFANFFGHERGDKDE